MPIKETPLPLKDPLVLATMAGTKTVTRRLNGLAVINEHPDNWEYIGYGHCSNAHFFKNIYPNMHNAKIKCPYGGPGDRLWVREAWAGDDLCGVVYRADHPGVDISKGELDSGEQCLNRWKPSIHMFRKDSRINLTIKSIRPERLQDITEEDAKAEGVKLGCPIGYIPAYQASPYVYCFAQLWDSINGKKAPWSSDNWVWRVEYEMLEEAL